MKSLTKSNIEKRVRESYKGLKNSETLIGIWYALTLFRVLTIYSIGTELYDQRQESFKCATKQFLCQTVCKDQFQPISPIQFWKWHIHTLVIVSILSLWISKSGTVKQAHESAKEQAPASRIVPRHVSMFVLSILLFVLELIFAYIFCQLLAKQHNPKEKLSKLLESGELFLTPPVYMCQIEQTYSAKDERLYYEKENVRFRQSPAGLRVKAQLSCAQSEPLCAIERSSEKTVLTLGMSVLNSLAIISLSFDILVKSLMVLIRLNRSRRGQPVSAVTSSHELNAR